MKKVFCLLISILIFKMNANAQQAEQKVNELLSKLSIEEKISLLGYKNKGVKRQQIPMYNWWNEALHGVARAGKATVFPQAG